MADSVSDSGSLPDEIVQSIAISNSKSIGEQPAILANLALANQILNNNLASQMFITQQQAMNQITQATVARVVSLILGDDGTPTEGKTYSTQQAMDLVADLQRQFQVTQKAIADASQANLEMSARFAQQLQQSQTQGN